MDYERLRPHIELSRFDGVEAFVNEYLVDFDRERALIAASAITGSTRRWPLANELVSLELDRKLQEHEKDSVLRAEYIRNFIFQILEFKPIDYFTPCVGGGWLVAQSDYDKLPDIARKLIEEVEYRVIRGEHYLAIRFVSKTKALELACRYTLAQKYDIRAPVGVPWDQVAAQPAAIDSVETQLAEVETAARERASV